MTQPHEPPSGEMRITAEEALFATDLAAHGMGRSGVIGSMDATEARKFAEVLFGDEGGLPEDLKQFFSAPEEES